ncbi:LuxR C-terminal-related transcriptional regulator [Planotetraspora phitsanulokensis]|uniref:Helix-turn-helix transcriptional regulator n=1 Tax=Planotetraspora phitsanulokensis TaxID=575192 RepID=A0A8J3XHR3_9ACTN|nr:helix-turn-helix transcriptional regulator [Planotetraspora phitsanulokensis]GII41569.1 helix-turn-helix transcriptional regulator [Planotetraspora phitsanulokensis]
MDRIGGTSAPGYMAAGTGVEVFEAAARRLRRLVPYDAAAWFGTDPATVLPTTPIRAENIEPVHCESYWHREYRTEDVLTFRDVARSAHAAGTLRQATGGSLGRSVRYQEFMRPQGYADNMRAAFRIGGGAWGVVDLFRFADRPPFDERDLRHIARLAPEVAMSLAGLAVTNDREKSGEAAEPPGTALFDDDDRVTFADAHAERWFGELCGSPWTAPSNSLWTAAIYSVVARARAVAAERESGPAVVRLRGDSGRWFSIHASVLYDRRRQPGPVTVVIEPATSGQIVPIIVEAYSLTPREREVTERVARGHSTTEIAKRLHLSPHTVRDHLKSIFAKVDVSSRGELVAKLFGEHYNPLMHSPDAELVHIYGS